MKLRAASSLPGGEASARAHSARQPDVAGGFAQPCRSAGQSASARSAPQSGKSRHAAGSQRERGCTIGTAALSPTAGALARGGAAHAASMPRIAATVHRFVLTAMWLVVLEALAALSILILIVWWTMFSGRPRGERSDSDGR